jgi:hypothetical protein
MAIMPRLRAWSAVSKAQRLFSWIVFPGLGGLVAALIVIGVVHLFNDPAEQIAAWEAAWEKQAIADKQELGKVTKEKDSDIAALTKKLTLPKFNIIAGRSFFSMAKNTDLDGRLYAGPPNVEKAKEVGFYPIDWLVYVTLTNNQDIPTTVMDLWAVSEDRKDDPSRRFCPIQLRGNAIYFLGDDLNESQIWSTEKALDLRLSEKEVPPHHSVSGWMAWYCPAGLCGPAVKLGVREANGRVSETESFPFATMIGRLQNNEFDASKIGLGGMVIHPYIPSDDPRSTGAMGLGPRRKVN